MRQIFEKNMRMLSNLLSYCHELGGLRHEVELAPGRQTSTLRVRSQIPTLDAERLEQLRATLRIPRQPELEQNYWYLGGESETGSNLTLVAVMSDSAEVSYREGWLTISLVRHE
ncbi:MAG: hypothetical protein ACOX2L_00160 [Anaerolineae bacterium]|jgi:hypothetical protein|nr:hypothetical protein [Chloroflexota bacterium]